MEEHIEAAVAETHISYVFFVGGRAYKLKKPVTFDFADLAKRAERERLCHREVELNRRLAPDVYLGVLDVVDDEGRPVDHLVEMVRLPDKRRLSSLVDEPPAAKPCLRDVARLLAAFHAGAERSDEITSAGSRESVERNWLDNLHELAPFADDVLPTERLERTRELAERYLAGRGPLFTQRADRRLICDGHGDLLADDIFCMDDGPRVLDCIEFNDRLRFGDVLADVAFLAMDLERRGAPELADEFLQRYREFSAESHPQSLAHHFIAYRAIVRCKVACLKHAQGDDAAAADAAMLLALSLDHLEKARARLVLIGGLPGTGKSTLAELVSSKTGWVVLRSDEIRKDIAGVSHDAHGHTPADFGQGIYAPEITKATYDAMLTRAGNLLEMGESVVLDASWLGRRRRAQASRVADSTASDLLQLRCVVPAHIAAQRMEARRGKAVDVSDADASIAERMAASFEDWPDAIEIQTDGPPDAALAAALRAAV